MSNLEIAQIFREIAKILEIRGENVFRVRAYERAAQNIEGLSDDLEEYIAKDALLEIPGIGKDLSEKIKEFARTGRIRAHEELKESIPHGLLDLLKIPSVGPKTAKLLYEKLNIGGIPDLEKAIEKGKLKGIFGIREKTVGNISRGIELVKKGKERITLAEAMRIADGFIGSLKALPAVKKISCAGSLRRQKDTVRDIDILAVSSRPQKIMDVFVNLRMVSEVLAEGLTKSSVRTKEDVQVDCRVVEERSFGAALLYFTGSKNFNIKIRQLAIKKGLKINEYGVFRNEKFVCGRTEEEVFKALGMSYIEPELREDSGEIERAKEFALPQLVELGDMRGDLHVHSEWSDGNETIQDIAEACRKRGYAYVAITDHSQSLKIARGLSVADLKKKRKQVDAVNKDLKGFRVLFATEVDIDSEGGMDYDDDVLKRFDIVIAAIHSGFKQSREKITRRLQRACDNRYVHVVAHPTGRLWGVREAYDIDFDLFFKAAKDTHTHLEINSFPQRLDLNDVHCRRAKEMGIKFAINTDAHVIGELEAMKLGVSVARRGWLSKTDIINTRSLDELLKVIKK